MGQFARIDYQKASMHRRQHVTAVSSLSLQLPPSTHNPYFYDVVGNVSTSRFRPSSSSSLSGAASNKPLLPSQKRRREPAVLDLQPRYPLLGGWNYSFTVGYDLPLGEFVKARGGGEKGRYVAAVPFLTPVKDVSIEDVRVEVRLPEGARCVASFPLSPRRVPRSRTAHEVVDARAASQGHLGPRALPTHVALVPLDRLARDRGQRRVDVPRLDRSPHGRHDQARVLGPSRAGRPRASLVASLPRARYFLRLEVHLADH